MPPSFEALTTFLNQLPDPAFVKDAEHRWVACNDAFCMFLGRERSDVLGKSDHDFFSDEEADRAWLKDDQALVTDDVAELEGRWVTAEGHRRIHLTKKKAFAWAPTIGEIHGQIRGRIRHVLGVMYDVTHLEERAQHDRLASIGELAARMAHEINNPLTAVTCNLALAIEQLDARKNPELAELLRDAMEGARRVSSVVGTMQALASNENSVFSFDLVDRPKITMARKRVLAVDDEALVRRLVQRVLSSAYEVVTVGSGAEALEVMDEQASFDAILCDVRMPEMSGLELHDAVQQRWPELADRFVFASGGVDLLADRLAATGRPIIDKPFEPGAIRDAIAAITAARAAR